MNPESKHYSDRWLLHSHKIHARTALLTEDHNNAKTAMTRRIQWCCEQHKATTTTRKCENNDCKKRACAGNTHVRLRVRDPGWILGLRAQFSRHLSSLLSRKGIVQYGAVRPYSKWTLLVVRLWEWIWQIQIQNSFCGAPCRSIYQKRNGIGWDRLTLQMAAPSQDAPTWGWMPGALIERNMGSLEEKVVLEIKSIVSALAERKPAQNRHPCAIEVEAACLTSWLRKRRKSTFCTVRFMV